LITDETIMNDSETNRWKKSRGGAWSVRGFHYQHLFTSLILVRQWAGLAPAGLIVPEGLEDCVIELPNHEIWIQIKSRESGTFSEPEVKTILGEVANKAAPVKSRKKKQFVLGLEQSYSGVNAQKIDQLFENKKKKIIVCGKPEMEIISLLTEQLETAEIIAEGLKNDIYALVAEVSAANAALSFKKRRRISTTEIERRIFERLEAEDPSAIDAALVSRVLEPVDFLTPIIEPGFYQGVKAKPGHVAAGLIIGRPTETNSILGSLKQQRHLLIVGPSGSGKSALMWLAANSLASWSRCFQITVKAGAQDADAIIRFLRARRPKELSPIALLFDEVGARNSNLWDILVSELRGLPNVNLLGSIRNEDVNLIANQSDTAFLETTLDEKLAQKIWEKLTNRNQTSWSHWREPFEQSDGLMLEYVHILTQRNRLASLISEQVQQREKEERHDELAIIRSTAVLCAIGGEIDVRTLFSLLEFSSERGSHALKRLIDEHLVRESRPGVLGGLHTLRSLALRDSSHDEMVYCSAVTFWKIISAATVETLPSIVHSLFAEGQNETEQNAIMKLAGALENNRSIDFWAAILTGIGLGVLERRVTSFITILKQHGIQKAHWSLASMFASTGVDASDLSQQENWKTLRNAISEFREMPKCDLRATCLEMLPKEFQMPACTNLKQVNKLLSCLVPITEGESFPIEFMPNIPDNAEHDIHDIATLLSTAYMIGPDVAQKLAEAFGDEQALLPLFHSQTPWLDTPTIDPNGNHGRTVRANWFQTAEDFQPDPHATICSICETLIALSPTSEAAASDVIDPSGQVIAIGDFVPWSKNIPRNNLPAKSRVAWNVAFGQIFRARSTVNSLTDYTEQMSELVRRTEQIFRSFSEKWIRGAKTDVTYSLADEIKEVVERVNSLTFAMPEKPERSMVQPAGKSGTDDKLGSLLTGVLNNLYPRMKSITAESGIKGAATFAGSLAHQAQEQNQSPIWRTTSSPPLAVLMVLSDRLENTAHILHEMAHDNTPERIARIVKAAKKGRIGKAIQSAARHCKSSSEKRFKEKLRSVENALKQRGWTAMCQTRPVIESDSVYWPPEEIAVLVKIEDFEKDAGYLDESLSVGRDQLGDNWQYRVVPVINGLVVAELAMRPSSLMPMPDQKFSMEWQSHIDLPFVSAKTSKSFEQAVKACNEMSAILNCCNLDNLHPEEEDAFEKAGNAFEYNHEIVKLSAEKTNLEEFEYALGYLNDTWSQVKEEFETIKAGKMVDIPLCINGYRALSGDENEETVEFAVLKVILLQAECRMTTPTE